ncbi:N-terminal kinase-like protein isoform X1 [Selaginella moellendorffii]|uniref:N-terminal kinase-like protein isoform X1 n=1 Tax=Selaginella moellendorffii TaxID=88036 RepID=UPI000D1C3501|nr:N-terminal kinase-like protein isoform X1 [Selaginella moellendorffii]|eukprot:XP_024515557.1 N-terminal kinase-like protein isoform X1 [Selaginella moellendorffii]
MLKFLKGVVGSAAGGIKDLPYSIGDPYAASWGSWTHCQGTSKEDNSPVSIFSFTASGAQDGRLAPARNGVKRLRTVRHPNVLSFLHSTEVEGMEGKITIYVVTEPVMPLAEKIKDMGLIDTQRDEYFAWGLHQVSKAVSFLNNDCKLVHGNVCLSAVVVTPALDWKLHAFDVLAEFDGANPEASGPMLQYEWLVGSQYKSLEFAKADWALIRKSPQYALDAWGLGCLIYELFSNTNLAKTEDLRNTAPIPKNLLPDYQRLLSSQPSRRLNPSKLIENSDFFQNKLVETIQFMEVLNLKDSVEKDSFFRKLSTLVEQLPRQIVLKKILPMVASALEFGSAAAPALTPFLKMGAWLSQDELTSKVVPTIVKLFASTDRAIRASLLQNIDQYGNAFPSQLLDEQVFPHLATGFSDTSALLRELTLKSMLILAPKLSQRTITGSLLKHLSKLQVDEEPAIRTNTTILLGNIAGLLNDSTRKRVLINAFTVRALRDGFAPARGAGIMALTATSQYYDVVEIATRVLPSLVNLTIDADSDVRTKAFEATETFLQLVRKHHNKQLEDGVSPSDNASILPVATSGLLGWAVSSLKTKAPDLPSQTSGTLSTVSSEPIAATAAAAPSVEHHQPARQPSTSLSEDFFDSVADDQRADDERDGWDDMEDSAAATATPSLSRIQAAQQRPIASAPLPSHANTNGPEQITTGATVARQASKTQVSDDEDPWAEIAAPPPSTKPRAVVSTQSRVRQGQHVSLGAMGLGGAGRGRGRSSAAPMKLGAQRVTKPPP